MAFGTAPFGTVGFGSIPEETARPALQLYRRAGTGAPSSLSFGEPAFSDGEPRLYVGNSDGSISTFVDKAYVDAVAKQPGARVYSDTALVVAANTIVAIPFNQERHDANGWHDNATNNTRITVPIDGTYHVGASVYIYPEVPNSPGIIQIYLRVRQAAASTIRWLASHSVEVTGAYAGDGDFYATMSISSVHQFVANDYAEVWIANQTAGSLTLEVPGVNPGRFQYFQDFFVQRLTNY